MLMPILLTSKQSYSANSCISKDTKRDICKIARELSNEIAKELPIRMSKNMSWETVASVGSTIIANIRLYNTRTHLNSVYEKAGLQISAGKELMIDIANNSVCSAKPVKAFIDLGGKITYVYRFIDGEQFIAIDVRKCD